MTQIIGHLKNLSGKFFAKDEQGNLREIFPGDPVYGGEVVVDESGKIIQEVLQISTQDEIDQNSGELDIEAALRRDDFEYDSPEGVIDAVRSTVSINSIDSPLSEENFDVLLREAEFYIENTGLIQEHEASNEVSVDAPLREYGFDRYEIGNMGRFTDNYNLNQVEDFGNIVGSTLFDSPTSSNDPFNPSDRNLLNIPSIPSDPNSPNIPSIPNDPNPPSTPSNPSFSNIPNNSNPPSTPNDPNLPNIPSTPNDPNDLIDPSRPLDSNPPNTPLIPTDPNDLTDPSRPLDSKDPEEKVVGAGGGGGFVPPHVPTANPDTNRATEDDTTSIISANIFDNTSDDSQDDVIGTDITPTPVTGVKAGSDTSTNAVGNIGLDVVGNYGTVQIANDGNYTYRLDNTKVEVQALNNEETLTDTFIYTITDDDGDTSTTTLTITIYGDNNDLPTLSINPEIVYESALVDGSSPDDRDIVSDTFTVGAIDGLKEIVVDGHIISKAELLISDTTAIIIENTTDKSNKLVINGFDESTGEVKYTYTLLDNNDNTLLANDASLTDTISIVVNDTDESGTTNSVTKDLLITIIDDTAVAKDNNATVVEGATEITGNVITDTDTTDGTDAVGADGAMLNEFTYRDINGVQQSIIFTDNTNQVVTTKTGSLTVNQDGAWTFAPIASVVHDDTNAIDESFKYKLIDNDGDISNEATNTITITDTIATVVPVATVILDEDDLSNGSDTDKESLVSADTTLGITVGQDDITDVVFDLTKVSADSNMTDLKSGGEALVFTVDATNHILTAKDHSGSDVFVVTINDNATADKYDEGSTYKFELKGSLDHASADGENTISVDIPFSIKEIDDIVNSKMRVDVVDDIPVTEINTNDQNTNLQVDETTLGTDASKDFSGSFTNTRVDAGADGPESLTTEYSLGATVAESGLLDTAIGEAITLSTNASGVVEGRTATSNDLVFTVSTDNSGKVTLDQIRAIKHSNPNNDNEASAVITDNLITLTKKVIIVDNDGDSTENTASLDIGSNISFLDDAPIVEIEINDQNTNLQVDETTLGTDASKDFSGSFSNTTVEAGADGQESLTTEYTLGATVADSGLLDTATGEAINLSTNVSGVVEGRTTTSDDLVFTVSTDNSGKVTLNQIRAIKHSNPNNDNEASAVITDNLITLTKKVIIVDNDGDSTENTASLDIGSNISFLDDAPIVEIEINDQNTNLQVDETTLGTDASKDFSGSFSNTTVEAGADGQESLTTEYSLGTIVADSGLLDTATGEAITLSTNVSGVVEGRTATSDDLVFTVSTDNSGEVTLNQIRAIKHSNPSNENEASTVITDNLITLTKKVIIVDNDGDSTENTASLDIGSNISFLDDAPIVEIEINDQNTNLQVDETTLGTDASKDFSGSFSNTTVDAGADGQESLTTEYTLGATVAESGLLDTATGEAINLSTNASGVVEGRTATSGDLVFTVSTDNSGKGTLDQIRAIKHSNPSDENEASAVITDNLITLTKKVIIVDKDGDTTEDTASLDIGSNISFLDDVSLAKDNNATVVEDATEITGNVITDTDTTDGTDAVGADGAMLNEFTYRDINGVQQSIIFTDNTNQVVTTKTGSLTVNQDGAWTFAPIASVVHDDTNAIDESFKYKLIDNDGDISNEATNTITITDTIATVVPVATVILDEDDLSNGSDTDKESLVSADTTLGITVGQDDITDVVFDLTKVSADSNMTDLKSGGEALVFTVDATNHILTAKDHSGSDVFVVTINDNATADKYDEGSTYKFELKGSLDHASADGENTISVDIPFSIKEIDDIVNAKMRVDVVDDVPIANDNPQQDTVEGSGVALGGNLIVDADATDIVGADNAELKEFTYRDDSGVEQTLIFADDTNQTVQTETGELTINRNGIWTFDPMTSFDHDDNLEASDSLESTDDMPEDASNASFSYTLVDGDGDESTAKQIINVIDGANPTIDNSKNTLIRVYEGDSISNLDGGTTKYDESDKTEIKENTATLTHKLDFTEGSDTAYISSITWEGRTKNLLRADGTFVNARKIVDDDKGILKVFKDGTWEYTPPATYEHDNPTTPDTFDINSLTTTFSYKVHDIDNDEVTGGSQSIQIDDTIATITEITDVLLNEANLASGTDPDNTELTQTGSITVDDQYLGGADHTVRFKAIQSDTILTIDNDGDGDSDLSSLGSKVHHEVSADGFTLTLLNESNESILTTTIDNPTAENITYTTVLSKSFNQTPALHRDESGNQDDDGMFYFEFDIEVEDDDGDIRDAEFKVTIADDETPDTGSMIVNEDSTENILQSNANVTQDNTEIITQGAHGIAQIDINGKFNYVPTENYSGVDQVIVETTLDDGSKHTVTMTITVNPLADVPEIEVTNITTIEDANEANDSGNEREGANSVALGLTLPALSGDQTDQNGLETGDSPERNGYISITFEEDAQGTKITKGDGTELLETDTTSASRQLKIVIVDNDGNIDESYHHSGIDTTGVTKLTVAEYQALRIIHKEDDADNIKIGLSVTSYELDDSGVPLDLNSDELTSTTSKELIVDVIAVTDPVKIKLIDTGDDVIITDEDNLTVEMNEDAQLNMKDILQEEFADLDNSELHSYKVDGFADGTIVTINGVSQTYTGSELTFTFSNDNYDPTFTIKTKENYSGDMSATIKLIAHDSDSDSDESAIVDESDAIMLNLHVKPVADDVTVDGVSTQEDTAVAFLDSLLLTDSDTDGSEEITELIVKALKDGWILKDESGTTVLTGDGSTNHTIDMSTVTMANLRNYTVTPPAHSSKDDAVDISVKVKDTEGTNSDIQTFDHSIDIEVLAVTDKENKDSDNSNGNDVALNIDHIYETHGTEDILYDLFGADSATSSGFVLSASNEDDESVGGFGSEVTTIVFDNIRHLEHNDNDGVNSIENAIETSINKAVIQYTNSDGNIVTKTINAGDSIEVPLDRLDSVKLLPPPQFAGSLRLDMKVVTEDFDEDDGASAGKETSSTSELTIMYIDPVAEEALVFGIAQSVGYEDDGRNPDGSTDVDTAVGGLSLNVHVNTLDTTETFNIYFDNIPEDAAIYYDINGDGIKELITAEMTGLEPAEIAPDTATSDVISDNGDGTWKLLIENYDNDNIPILVPPHNSNVDFDIDVSGYAVDSVVFADGTEATDVSEVSDTYPIAVKLKGIADELSGDELNTLSIYGTDDGYGGKTDLRNEDDVDGVYAVIVQEDNNNIKDGAEINLKDVFKNDGVLNSYDNVADNDPTQTPTDTGSYDSETLTVSLTGLAVGFEVEGALSLGGTGKDRVWVMKHTAINDGDVKITTAKHYSGEVDFKLKYITTEDDGDSLTTPLQDVKVLVTPVVEATIFDASETTLKEDTLTQLDFKSKLESADSDEEIVELLVLKSDIDSKTFEVYYGNSQEITLEEAATNNDAVEIVTIDNIEYYKIHDTDTENLYAQHNSDIGGTEENLDNSFSFKYIVRDQANAVDADGNAIVISDLQATPYEDATYKLGFEAVTDEFDVSIKNAGITSTNVNDISVDSNEITINANTTISVAVTLLGKDMTAEVELDNSATTNGRDEDGSEMISRLKVDGLPDGIGVVGGYKIGNGTQADTSDWYINIPINEEIVFDGGEKSYNMEFEVFGDNSTYLAQSSDVKVTFYNQDGSADTVEDSVILKFIKNADVDGFDDTGAIGQAPMDILTFEENSTFVAFLEDREQALSDIITLNINDSGTNVQLNEEITSQKFLLEVKDIVNGSATITEELNSSTENQWIKYEDSYIYRGEGDESAIQTALDNFSITATQDDNWNTGRESDPDKTLDFTANITTYTASGVEDYASFDYSGEVKPVTDDVTAVQTITDSNGDVVGSIKEDEIGKIELDLSSVDGEYRSSVESEDSTELATSYIFTYSSDNTFDVTINDTVLKPGDEIAIDITELNNIKFEAEANEYGEAKFSYKVYSHENDADNIVSNDLSFSVRVDPVADGSVDPNADGSNPLEDVQAIGDEDTFIEITSDVGKTLTNLLGGGSETLTSLMLKGVPNGYLVYIGEEDSQELAMNAGKDGETVDSNSWYLQLNGDEAPRVWIKAPNNIGGVAPTSLLLKTGVDNSLYREDSIDLQVNAIADKLAIKPSDTRGNEGDEVRLYFNMAAEDVDGSEYYEVKLKGLGEGALFTLDGTVIDENDVTYHSDTDIYTIASTDVTYETIDKIYVIQNDLKGKTIDATVDAIEKSNNNRDGASTTASFKITIEDQKATDGDDTLMYDDAGVDGGDGVDTVYLAGDTSLDTTALKNIEILDMTKYDRDYTFNNLTTQAVTDMTDENNELIIRADGGDHIDLEDIEDVAGGWTKLDDTHYHSFDDPSITVTFNDNSALIDGVIEGMYYETSSGFTGYTDTDGNFDYIDGDTVIFKIGSLVIGSMDMNEINDDKVFLQDLASVERSDMSDAYVENMAVLLQSLDGDNTDKILITEEMQDALSEEEFDLATVEQDELVSIIEKTGKEAVSTEDAMEHVEEMIEEYDGVEKEEEESDDVAEEEESDDVAEEEESDDVAEEEEESGDVAEDEEESDDVAEDEEESDDVEEDEEESDDVAEEEESDDVEEDKEASDTTDLNESINLETVEDPSTKLNNILPTPTPSTPTDTPSSPSSTSEPISSYAPDPTVAVTVDDSPDVLI